MRCEFTDDSSSVRLEFTDTVSPLNGGGVNLLTDSVKPHDATYH